MQVGLTNFGVFAFFKFSSQEPSSICLMKVPNSQRNPLECYAVLQWAMNICAKNNYIQIVACHFDDIIFVYMIKNSNNITYCPAIKQPPLQKGLFAAPDAQQLPLPRMLAVWALGGLGWTWTEHSGSNPLDRYF